MIYFIRAGSAYCKVGYSATEDGVRKRLASMQTGCPLLLNLVATAEGTQADERRLHAYLRPVHVRGEWFRYQWQLRYIVSEAQGGRAIPWARLARDHELAQRYEDRRLEAELRALPGPSLDYSGLGL